jgi:putative FmdB family regulatory protein
MPFYEYRCDKGHTFEVVQRMTDDPLSACESCGAPARRVFHPVAVHFKGSGFYNTDYGKKKRGAAASSSDSGSSKDSGSSDKPSKKAESSASSSSTD